MSIINVNTIQPIGAGQTVTVNASDLKVNSISGTSNTITIPSGHKLNLGPDVSLSSSGISTTSGFIVSVGGNEDFIVDTAGRVRMPYQPVFMVRGDETGSKAQNTKFSFTSSGDNAKVNFDRGNNWSDANDRFTAPVAGTYHFYFGLYRQSATSTVFSVAPRVNNSQLSIGDTFIFFTSATGETGNPDDGMYGSFTLNLSENDYVELFIRGGAPTITMYSGHSFFGGHLIG